MPRPERPSDGDYYERDRVELFSQGDLFRDVPLAYPSPAHELLVDEAGGGRSTLLDRATRFRAGDAGHAELLTRRAGHDGLRPSGPDTRAGTAARAARRPRRRQGNGSRTTCGRFDHLINYMYLPPLDIDKLDFSMPESVALLYMPVTLHHAFLEGQRVSQLAYRGAQQLQRKLVWFYSGWLEDDLDVFDPPMD